MSGLELDWIGGVQLCTRTIIVHLNWAQSSVKISPECINFSHKLKKNSPHTPRPLALRLKSRPRSHFLKLGAYGGKRYTDSKVVTLTGTGRRLKPLV